MRGKLCALGSALAVLAAAAPTLAQTVPRDQFNTNRFFPAPGPGNYVMVDGGAVGGHLSPTASLLIDYAHRPFVLFDSTCPGGDEDDCSVENAEQELIAYQLTTNLMGTLSLWRRLQIGLTLPLVLSDGDSYARSTPDLAEPFVDIRGGRAFGPGDPRLSAKVGLVGRGGAGFHLAAVAYTSAPLGKLTSDTTNLGEDTVTGGGHLAAEIREGRFRVAANAGGIYRPARQLLSTEVGSEFTYGVGMALDATSLLSVVGEVTGVTQFTSQLDEAPIEARLAALLTQGDFVFTLGAGPGLLSGVGVPDFRVFGGVSWQPAGLDSDGDGIPDKRDRCVAVPEDLDGYQDEDGCPDFDNDGDGIPDTHDKCPDEPEDMDGFEDEDGCPDPDNDGDGIPDGYDSCPNEPEDIDGDRDQDGCPDHDRDRDGIPDDVDDCPDEPEDIDGLQDEDGCPEDDADGDGIPDDDDLCPLEPEDFDGVEDEDGCPDGKTPPPPAPAPPKVVVTCDKIEISDSVYFETGKSKIQARSFALLDQVAEVLNEAKHVKKVRIEGHTDSQGSDKGNLRLSQGRAEAVRVYIESKAVVPERLVSEGFGETRPIADNKTKEGRTANRRVDFVILEQDTKNCPAKPAAPAPTE